MASILLSNLPRLHDLRSHARFGGIYALIYWNLEAPVAHLFFK